MKKTLFLLSASASVFYAGCASGPASASRNSWQQSDYAQGDRGRFSEVRVEGQMPREAGLAEDEWTLKSANSLPTTATTPMPMPARSTAAGGPGMTETGSGTVSQNGAMQSVDQADIPLHKEELVVGKREVSNGGVLIRKIVQTENVTQPISLRREEFVIQRVPANDAAQANATDANRLFQPQEIFVPLMREEPVVTKRAVLTETVRIGKRTETERETITRPVRTEDVEVVKNPNLPAAQSSPQAQPIANPQPGPASPAPALANNGSGDTLNLAQEELVVSKRAVPNGGVLVRKVVHSQEASQPIELRREELDVQRTPANHQAVASADFQPREIRIDLTREEPVISTRSHVTEIVRVEKQTHTDNQVVSDTVRKESLDIAKTGSAPQPAVGGAGASTIQSGSGAGSSSADMPTDTAK